MRRYEKRTETVEREVLAEVTCDLCGKKGKHADHWGESTWVSDEVAVKVTMIHEHSEGCADGGSGTRVTFDICPACFRGKLVPFLESQGAKVNREAFEW